MTIAETPGDHSNNRGRPVTMANTNTEDVRVNTALSVGGRLGSVCNLCVSVSHMTED